MRFATKAIRVGQDPDKSFRAVVNPIYQSATFNWVDLDHVPPVDYTRCANPNRAVLEAVIAALENGRHCTVFSSGMAAIMGAFSFLRSGDHVLMATDIYGGTFRACDVYLPRMGVSYDEFDASDPNTLARAKKPNTKLVVYETPTNPTLKVCDVKAVADEARRLGLISVFDNTFASPYLMNPLDLGVDVVVHSTTKYVNGHSDVIGGALITNDDAKALAVFEYLKAVGSSPSPFDCWLALRGVKTLPVRMRQHCENAQTVAEFLDGHPKVARVHYPGLPSHPDHAVAKRQMRAFGAMVSVEIAGPSKNARKVAESTKIFQLAESLGGVESLIAYPPLMSHASMTEEQRLARGIPPTLLRLSVGIEDKDDLVEDLAQALGEVECARAGTSVVSP
jgi:cystathionine beta-lyase/cystathionine gamma-synthase